LQNIKDYYCNYVILLLRPILRPMFVNDSKSKDTLDTKSSLTGSECNLEFPATLYKQNDETPNWCQEHLCSSIISGLACLERSKSSRTLSKNSVCHITRNV